MTQNSTTPIFPCNSQLDYGGLTKREWLAGLAMQGLLSNYEARVKICNTDPRYNDENFAEVVAINSVEFADALLKQLDKI